MKIVEKTPSGTPTRRSSTNTPDSLLTGPPGELCQVLSKTALKNESTSPVQNEKLVGHSWTGTPRTRTCSTVCNKLCTRGNFHRPQHTPSMPGVRHDRPADAQNVGSAAERAAKPKAVPMAGPVHQTHRGLQSTFDSAQARICCANWCVGPGETLGSG